jgi:hypothetical protein
VVLPVLWRSRRSGAFVGPDATLAGVPAVVVVALACVALRRRRSPPTAGHAAGQDQRRLRKDR